MIILSTILISALILSLFLSYQSNLPIQKSAIEIVNEMGFGYNLANSFDCYNNSIEINNPNEQITLLGNPIPTQKMINNIKKNGFKTIRFPVTWANFIDNLGNVNPQWMLRVKEVVKWIINKNIYCILNIYHDSDIGNWIYDELNGKDKYFYLWKQIAEEFKDFNEYLLFESMNQPKFIDNYWNFKHDIYYNFTQGFIDILRKSGGFNSQRLLIISGYQYFDPLPLPLNDTANKLAVSFNYYEPFWFTSDSSLYYLEWGRENEYKTLFNDFEKLKENYIDKGIPIILSEIGVKTESKKNILSIREYLYTLFSLSFDYSGLVCCLQDTSNKIFGDMNFYDRETDKWHDDKIKDIFNKLSKNKNLKVTDFFITTKNETTYETSDLGDYIIHLSKRKPLKLILNLSYKGELFVDYDFSISSLNKDYDFFDIMFGKENGKKQYDGTIIYTIDLSKEDCNVYIEIIKWDGDEMFFNNVTIEYNETSNYFDYKSYRHEVLKEIS